MRTRFITGCGGWNYKDWAPSFYPGPRPDLSHYATVFDATEADFTYYRIPMKKAMTNLVDRTPEDFEITVKLSRSLLPYDRLDPEGELFQLFLQRIRLLGPRLRFLLVQLPANYKASKHISNVEKLLDGLESLEFDLDHVVFEFRHSDWSSNDDLRQRFEDSGVVWAWTFHPSNPDTPVVGETGYLRLIGDKKAPWHQGITFDQIVHDASEETARWVQRFERADFEKAYIFTKNTYEGNGPASVNAVRTALGLEPIVF